MRSSSWNKNGHDWLVVEVAALKHRSCLQITIKGPDAPQVNFFQEAEGKVHVGWGRIDRQRRWRRIDHLNSCMRRVVCDKVASGRLCLTKLCVTKLCVRKMVCDKVVRERWCVTKLCVKEMCVKMVCDKVVCERIVRVVAKMVCDKVVCERWCVTKLRIACHT